MTPPLLTFDDGPDEIWTPLVLAVLAACEVRATFFLVGERVREAPATVREIVSAGHEIALHCDRHIRHADLQEHEIEADTVAALAALAELGVRPQRWRTPWGVCTPATIRVAERHELELVHWSVDTHDWRGDSVAQMLDAASSQLGPGAVVLMHDGLGPGALREGCENTVDLIAPLCALATESIPTPVAVRA